MSFQSNPLNLDAFVSSHEEFKEVSKEDLLDVQMSIMDEEDVHRYVEKCMNCLRIFDERPDPESIVKIPLSAFEGLFLEATRKRLHDNRYITALKIFMGSQENVGIVPIFQPAYLKRARYDAVTQKELYQIPSYGYGRCYKFVEANSMFEEIGRDERMKLIESYKTESMEIIRQEGEPLSRFKQDTDVESCLFPFQTLFKLIQETPSDSIFLTNAIREVIVDNTYENKHVFIVSGEKINFEGPEIKAKFANRSHLCPPCNAVDFGFDVFALSQP